MIITCPKCNTTYQLPDSAIPPSTGKKVRCQSCKHVWLATKEMDPSIKIEPSSEILISEQTPNKIYFWIKIQFAFTALFSLFLTGFYLMPTIISKHYSALRPLYESMHILEPKLNKSLLFSALKFDYKPKNKTLSLESFLINQTARMIQLPNQIEILAFNAKKQPVQTWQFELSSHYLEADKPLELNYTLDKVKPEAVLFKLKIRDLAQ